MARPDLITKEELKQLAALWPHPLAWIVASVVLAGRAQGLGVLAHDACHLAYFPSRRLNLWAGAAVRVPATGAAARDERTRRNA